jgi:hypothetical protein
MDVIEQRLQIVRHNQEIIHSQRDELTAFGIGPTRVSDDDDDEEQANDGEEMEDDE